MLLGMMREGDPSTWPRTRPDRPVSCFTAHLREGPPGCSRRCWDIRRNPHRDRALRSGRGVGYCVYFFFFKKGDIDDFG